MEQYLELVEDILSNGVYKPNRTGVDTVAVFDRHYRIDLQKGFPLLTTKEMSDYRWDSLIHELLWFLKGEEHIRNLQEKTQIWDAWADEDGNLETAYGRFWRRYPLPKMESQLNGENWVSEKHRWVNEDGKTFDQIQYAIDMLNENPNSRRIVINAWHPANASTSKLPPCHYTFAFNVQDGKLNTHLTQRSGDVALGVPFNIASYSVLAHAIANQTNYNVGEFGHTIIDAHAYAGEGKRGQWYEENIEWLNDRVAQAEEPEDYLEIRNAIEEKAPGESVDGMDHIPRLLTQLSREPLGRSTIDVANKPLSELMFEDIQLSNYDSHEKIDFGVAE